MTLTLIAHFFNEEYLLPWWVDHHLSTVDDAVLIDHGSTDESRDILSRMAPHWRVIDAPTAEFDAVAVDEEVMEVERGVSGWKVVLNVTEFLVGDARGVLERTPPDVWGLKTAGRTMVDIEPDIEPNPDAALVAQKPWGFDEFQWEVVRLLGGTNRPVPGEYMSFQPRFRNRLIHRHVDGQYQPGRHEWHAQGWIPCPDLEVWWFGLSPWTPRGRARKENARNQVSARDRAERKGVQHTLPAAAQAQLHHFLAQFAQERSWTPAECKEALHMVMNHFHVAIG